MDDPGTEAGTRRYSLPAGHDEALLDETSLNYIGPIGNNRDEVTMIRKRTAKVEY